ncbi:MAG: hypothetical protein JNL32_08255 [Candidatus Kapabacteria bacterium]|nr:hypothetical protein [Candidatus Kapabacteria bacterium]
MTLQTIQPLSSSVYGANAIDFSDTSVFTLPKQREFILGNQWGNSVRAANKAMHLNAYQNHAWRRFGGRDGFLCMYFDPTLGDWRVDQELYNRFAGIVDTANATSRIQPNVKHYVLAVGGVPSLMAMQYDPEVSVPYVNTSGFDYFQRNETRYWTDAWRSEEGDSSGAAFGFHEPPISHREYEGFQNGNKRILFTRARYGTTTDTIVLKNQLFPTQFRYAIGDSADNINHADKNGKRWFLSVKLRRANNLVTAIDTAQVLRLRIRYTKRVAGNCDAASFRDWVIDSLTKDTVPTYIQFQTVPDTVAAQSGMPANFVSIDSAVLNRGRGLVDGTKRKQVARSSPDSADFIIRRNMLPLYTAGENEITLSAEFWLDSAIRATIAPFNRLSNNNSLMLKTNGNCFPCGADSGSVTHLNIEAAYLGNCDVALDWIRIETDYARRTFRGKEDAWYAGEVKGFVDEFKTTRIRLGSNVLDDRRARQKSNGDTMTAIRYYPYIPEVKNARLDAIYLNDEPPIYLYLDHRYRALLLNKYAITEGGGLMLYRHIVPQNTYWQGQGVDPLSEFLSPAVKRIWSQHDWGGFMTYINWGNYNTFDRVRQYGYLGGYSKAYDTSSSVRNYEGSRYELAPILLMDSLKIMPIFEANNYYNFSSGHCFDHDHPTWTYYTARETWRLEARKLTPNGAVLGRRAHLDLSRPLTGEEHRNKLFSQIMMGMKGFMPDAGRPFHINGKFKADVVGAGIDMTPIIPGDTNHTAQWYGDKLEFMPTTVHYRTWYIDSCGEDFIRMNNAGQYIPEQTDLYKYVYPSELTGSDSIEHSYTDSNGAVVTYGEGLAIQPDRFYRGSKSVRLVTMQVHDWICSNAFANDTISVGDVLMDMNVMAWIGIGKQMNSVSCDNWRTCTRNNGSSGISSLFRRFLDTSFIKYRTRPVVGNRRFDLDTNRQVSVTLFHYKRGSNLATPTTISTKAAQMDSMFVIGVQNVLNSPFIGDSNGVHQYCNYDAHPSKLKFYSTKEFFDSVNQRGYHPYEQSGSREISIPLAYRHPDGKSRLLRVQEIGGTLDTILCRDCPLVANYQPGEGKFFRVTVIKPQDRDIDSGSLAFVNQHKLIAMPLLTGVDIINAKPLYDSTRLRYHLVYNRYDSVLVDGNPQRVWQPRIIYKRSKIIDRCSPVDVTNPALLASLPIWERTIVLSDSFLVVNGDTSQFKSIPCKYPSIVVKFDSVDQAEYVYAVYSCQKSADTLSNLRIVESQFASNDSVPRSQQLAQFDSAHIDDYGHPVVNASYHHNYYAYSTPMDGIMAGSRPQSRFQRMPLTDYKEQRLSYFAPRAIPTQFESADCRHPSVNTYSDLRSNEKECALVWQERNLAGDTTQAINGWQVYYTRLSLDSNNALRYSLPPVSPLHNGGAYGFNTTGTIARASGGATFSSGYRNHIMPSVVRLPSPATNATRSQMDKVLWEAINPDTCVNNSTPRHGVFISAVHTVHPSGAPDSLRTQWHSTIYSCQTVIRNITGNAAQSWILGVGGSSIVLNMDLPASNQLGHITMSYWAYGSEYMYISNASMAQLTHTPYLTNDYQWNYARRAFNVPSVLAQNPNITSSVTHLLKRNIGDELNHYRMVGFVNSFNTFSVSDMVDDNDDASLRSTSGDYGTSSSTDTICGKWFTVGGKRTVKFAIDGINYNVATMYVENRRTGDRQEVDANTLAPRSGRKVSGGRLALQNGGGDEYRFVFVKNIPFARTFEDIYLGASNEGLSKSSADGEETAVVDLSETVTSGGALLHAYPNPATDNVEVVLSPVIDRLRSVHAPVLLDVVDSRGEVVMSVRHSAGGTATLNTSGLASGAYTIRCSWLTADMARKTTATHIIISR